MATGRTAEGWKKGVMPEAIAFERGALHVTVQLDPFAIEVRRGRRLIRSLGLWAAAGQARDQFIQLTEGVIAAEELERPIRLEHAEPASAGSATLIGRVGAARAAVDLAVMDERLTIDFRLAPAPFRLGAEWESRPGERDTASSWTRRVAGCGSAATAATPGPTARPTCST
jgi:hypothetical protein